MKSRTLLRELFRYGDWAEARIHAAAAAVKEEALDRGYIFGSGTLRRVLHHDWAAERIWLDRWLGEPQPAFIEPEPGLPLAELVERWRATSGEREELLDRIGPGGERQRISYRNTLGEAHTYPLGDMMLHVANHGIHHRPQALALLRAEGVKLPRVDYLFYRLERPAVLPSAKLRELLRADGIEVRAAEEPAAIERDTLLDYFRYTDWALGRVFALCRDLDPETLDRRFEVGPGSLRRTLLHLRDAEQWWLDQWQGVAALSYAELPESTPFAQLEELSAMTARRRNEHLADGDLERPVPLRLGSEGEELSLPVSATALQLCGHGTHHRSQALMMLRACGVATPDLDYLDYVDAFA